MTLSPDVAGGDLQDVALAHAPAFSYAFQPIVDVVAREVFSYEALIRGRASEPAFRVLERVPPHAKYQFDEDSRAAALALAVQLGLKCHLNLNFLPQGLYASDASVSSTLAAAARHGLPIDRVILEVTEGEVIADYAHLGQQLNEFRSRGLKVAIDDFGAGYSGLNMLADFQPDQIKIDMNLVRGMACACSRDTCSQGLGSRPCRERIFRTAAEAKARVVAGEDADHQDLQDLGAGAPQKAEGPAKVTRTSRAAR